MPSSHAEEHPLSTDPTGRSGAFAADDESETPDDRARDEARRAVNAAILQMAHAAGAPVQERRIFPDSTFTVTDPEPLAGIGFALMLTDHARQQIHRFIRRAREDGADWREIGTALRLQQAADEHDGDLGVAAFEYAAGAPAQRFDRMWFGWDCPACRGRVIDYGPYGGHPDDCESGHAEGCQRRAAAIAAYEARWTDED